MFNRKWKEKLPLLVSSIAINVTCTHGNIVKALLQQWGFMLVSAKAG